MKLKKLNIKKYTLLKFHLIKYQAYKTMLKNRSDIKSIDNLQFCTKQALNLIYSYHSSHKRILFIGFPYIKITNFSRVFKHSFIQKSLWVNGLFGNKNAKKKSLSRQLGITNEVDLVVIFNATNKDLNILKEVSSIGCPIIVLGSDITFKSSNIINAIPARFVARNLKQLCSFLIYSILKK